jgi:predicted GH43/DUF377 family glycosyl hydrolase
MTPEPDNALEVEGVLNPATAWGADGELYLFPRLVAERNFSRVGRGRVIIERGVPTGVERQGIVLEPERGWERGTAHGGVEDPRIAYVPRLGVHVMTYVAFGPLGPRPAIAVSSDLATWDRLGPIQFEYDDALGTDLNLFPNKDVVFFPEVVRDPSGAPSYAVIHRPMWEFEFSRASEEPTLPNGVMDRRASIWISYIPAERAEADLRALARPAGHRVLATPEHAWEELKIGAGPPPIRVDEGWLLIHHGVSGTIGRNGFTPQKNVFYSVGALILSADDPSQVIARTEQPILLPETADETAGIVPNVVFPTAIEEIDGQLFVFYGMADSRIGVAALTQEPKA